MSLLPYGKEPKSPAPNAALIQANVVGKLVNPVRTLD